MLKKSSSSLFSILSYRDFKALRSIANTMYIGRSYVYIYAYYIKASYIHIMFGGGGGESRFLGLTPWAGTVQRLGSTISPHPKLASHEARGMANG